ncbi:MAG: acyl-CoA dehydrogenase family protein [Cytophagales bacterium]|nr:acyl-CoA dehydrogenase family protein [Cytophagales bacterium]
MIFKLSEEQKNVVQAARDFAQTYLLPEVIERDEEQRFPTEEIRKMGEMGFMGMLVSPKYGGGGMDTLSYVLALREIAKIDASAAVCMSVNNSLVCWVLESYGSEHIKSKYLIPLASAQAIGAFCLSEPESGSDATAQHTTAIEQEDHFLLNGTKNWITNGNTASYYVVIAQSNPEKKYKGINAFLVEKSWEGVVVGKKENKMGIRGSDTHSIMFQNVRVPKENLIGESGKGFNYAMEILNGGRIGIAAQALGIAEGAYELSLAYSKQRKAFGEAICNHQAIRFKLADMATRIEASYLLCLQAAQKRQAGEDFSKEAAMAKIFSSETAMWTTTEAVQIHGGYGYVKEYHVERLMRDAKITQIYEGTSEIQRLVISRAILGK